MIEPSKQLVICDALNISLAEYLTKSVTAKDSTLWVGLSAGVDSTVLLHALAQVCSLIQTEIAPKICAIHVHHGLSNNADEWALQAQRLCEQLSLQFNLAIECIVEKIQLGNCPDGLEQAARQGRYRVFEKYCTSDDVLLQGHHLDDQIETFFMRAIRGSGLKGLSSIPSQRSLSRSNSSNKSCQIIRPFLALEKSVIIQYAQQHQLTWVEDESNQDSSIERNWWRNELLPKIWHRYGNKKQALLRTVQNLQQEQALLSGFIQHDLIDKNKEPSRLNFVGQVLANFPSIAIDALPECFEIPYLRAWLSQSVDILPSAEQMQVICHDIIAAKPGADPSFIWSNKMLRRYRGVVYLTPQSLSLDSLFEVEYGCTSNRTEIVDDYSEVLIAKDYILRSFQPGDQIKLVNRPNRKLKKYWQELGIPPWLRSIWPILIDPDSGQVVLVFGLLVAEGVKATNSITGDTERCHCDIKIKPPR